MTHEEQIISVVKKTLPAVVSIIVGQDLKTLEAKGFPFYGEMPENGETEQDIVDRLPRTDGGKIRIGGGSGFLVDENGFILTNKHVVADPSAEYTVLMPNDEKFTATILARDPINDVAILKIDPPKGAVFPTIDLGDSNKILLGQSVVAVGNALGEFRNTVSTGIVSGLSRFITAMTDTDGHAERLRGLIQTDAAINPGNSGGPLMNLKSEVIGINSAIVFGAQNIGFAIPVNKAKKDLADVKKFGRIKKPFFGVRYILVSKDMKEKLGAPTDYGALVLSEGGGGHAVIKGSGAYKAGLRDRDIILEVNGAPINEKNALEDILEKRAIGDALNVKYLRGTTEHQCEVRLGEREEVA